LFFNSEILKLTFFILTVKGKAVAFGSLNTMNRFGRADCGMEKLFLEVPAVGDLGENNKI